LSSLFPDITPASLQEDIDVATTGLK